MNHAPADLDGDGEFDAIDIAILEEDNSGSTQPKNRNTGCCSFFMITGATFARVGKKTEES
jgi:hypothetical protein